MSDLVDGQRTDDSGANRIGRAQSEAPGQRKTVREHEDEHREDEARNQHAVLVGVAGKPLRVMRGEGRDVPGHQGLAEGLGYLCAEAEKRRVRSLSRRARREQQAGALPVDVAAVDLAILDRACQARLARILAETEVARRLDLEAGVDYPHHQVGSNDAHA